MTGHDMTENARQYTDSSAFTSRIWLTLFQAVGWHYEGSLPDVPKMVIIGVPHTSNWDGIVLFTMTKILRRYMNWLGKHTLFKPPLGPLMLWAGGVPVNRQTTRNAVEQVVDAFTERERMVLVIAPEGTRKRVDHWKTGFYYIALKAKVPIVMAGIDYREKVLVLAPAFEPSGDLEADFEQIIKPFYANRFYGRFPEKKGPVALPPNKVSDQSGQPESIS